MKSACFLICGGNCLGSLSVTANSSLQVERTNAGATRMTGTPNITAKDTGVFTSVGVDLTLNCARTSAPVANGLGGLAPGSQPATWSGR